VTSATCTYCGQVLDLKVNVTPLVAFVQKVIEQMESEFPLGLKPRPTTRQDHAHSIAEPKHGRKDLELVLIINTYIIRYH